MQINKRFSREMKLDTMCMVCLLSMLEHVFKLLLFVGFNGLLAVWVVDIISSLHVLKALPFSKSCIQIVIYYVLVI